VRELAEIEHDESHALSNKKKSFKSRSRASRAIQKKLRPHEALQLCGLAASAPIALANESPSHFQPRNTPHVGARPPM